MLKEQVLNFLELNKEDYLSGEKIATSLGVSRNAVWKAIRALEKEGYSFLKRTNAGYKLTEESNELSTRGIQKALKRGSKVRVEVFQSIDSTNKYLVNKASEGEKEGLLAVAKKQEAGRGRLGRNFFSPDGGVYFSLLLRPRANDMVKEYLTVLTALATNESINELFGVNAGIKWVNDVYIGSKKCAGILTEASIDFETGSLAYVVVGVGINLKEPEGGYPDEIKEVACAINVDLPNAKNRLVALVVDKLLDYYYNFDKDLVVSRYKENSIMMGRRVLVKREGEDKMATVVELDDQCRLKVAYENGEEDLLYYGEVSLCLKD